MKKSIHIDIALKELHGLVYSLSGSQVAKIIEIALPCKNVSYSAEDDEIIYETDPKKQDVDVFFEHSRNSR